MATGFKEMAESIFLAGLRRVDSRELIDRVLTVEGDRLEVQTDSQSITLDLSRYDRILVAAVGKAASRMSLGLHDLLGLRISKGLVVTKEGHLEKLPFQFEVVFGSHPVPDASSVAAAEKLVRLCTDAGPRDLVIGLISGGGSSLAALPVEGITLPEKQAVTRRLLASGASITEINSVRKRISKIKGGRLLEAIQPADSLNLILSDVAGDDLRVIASGMTVPHLEGPPPSIRLLHNVIVGSNQHALAAAAEKARSLGFETVIATEPIVGEAREAAHAILQSAAATRDRSRPACYLAGGETTVTIRGAGKGGRNQEMALAALLEVPPDVMFLSASTDGGDGPTDAAGAFASSEILERARQLGLDPREYLDKNDSYSFFEAVGGHLKTGPTNTNVCDLQIVLMR